MLYNIERLMKEANLNEKEKIKVITELKEEFPQDEMLFELHLFRILQHMKKEKLRNSIKPII